MGDKTKIEWCDYTFSPWRGCAKVAAGCKNCYADRDAKRFPKNRGVFGTEAQGGTRVVAAESMWKQPKKWNREVIYDHARRLGEPLNRPRVFTASLSDIFEEWTGPMMDHSSGGVLNAAPVGDGTWTKKSWWVCDHTDSPRITMQDCRKRLFQTIDETPNLDWLVLTKRPENIRKMWPLMNDNRPVFPGAPGKLGESIPCLVKGARRENVWLGCSVANQGDAEKNIHKLLECHDLVGKRFLSIEPMVGPVDISYYLDRVDYDRNDVDCAAREFYEPGIDWVIVGGESGPNARPCNIEWIRDIVRQCKEAGVPCFVKQLGSNISPLEVEDGSVKERLFLDHPKGGDIDEWPEDIRVREFPS